MKTYWFKLILIIGIASANLAIAKDFNVERFGNDELHLMGAQCGFSDGDGIILKSKMNKYWIKIDGKIIEFHGDKKLSDKGWNQTFVSNGITVVLRLKRVSEKGESVGFAGTIAIRQTGQTKKFTVKGFCGA